MAESSESKEEKTPDQELKPGEIQGEVSTGETPEEVEKMLEQIKRLKELKKKKFT